MIKFKLIDANRKLIKNFNRSFSTIFSLSSGLNNAHSNQTTGVAIAVVRVSGPQTKLILNSLTNGQFHKFKPREARLTNLYNKQNKNELIDKSIAIWFPKPNSYTGEDMCELHLHGSKVVVQTILQTLSKFEDTNPAENGEFTKRAFLNQKLSLIEAEAINELIKSRCDSQRKNALKGLSGNVVKLYMRWREKLIKLHSFLQADIEFGEDQLLDEEKIDKTIQNIFKIKNEISQFLQISSKRRHVVKDGFNICIVGYPNVGKSSLMNSLCDKELSIVSPFQGTTRDVIEYSLEINGYQVNLSDTAGIRNLNNSNENFVENQGIRKALEKAETADIKLILHDISKLDVQQNILKNKTLYLKEELNQQIGFNKSTNLDLNIVNSENGNLGLNENFNNSTIHVLNKVDLVDEQIKLKLTDLFRNQNNVILLSCKTEENFLNLIQLIGKSIDNLIKNHKIDEDNFLTERHESHLNRIVENIGLAIDTIDDDRSIASFYIENSINEIASITGIITTEQILDVIFKNFCIGK